VCVCVCERVSLCKECYICVFRCGYAAVFRLVLFLSYNRVNYSTRRVVFLTVSVRVCVCVCAALVLRCRTKYTCHVVGAVRAFLPTVPRVLDQCVD